MYRYVFRRVKETIEHGVNARKSFGWQGAVNQPEQQKQQQHQISEINFLVRPKESGKTKDDFKRKYNCKHPCCNPFLSAITWSTILIAGFYGSQLVCLYRRNKHFDTKKSFYARYLCQKNSILHKKFLHYKAETHRNSSLLAKAAQSFCPQKRAESKQQQQREDNQGVKKYQQNLNFTDLNFFEKRFQKFLHNDDDKDLRSGYRQTYNVSNEEKKCSETSSENTLQDKQAKSTKEIDAEIEEVMTNLSNMIGELEFQVGVDSLLSGRYAEAADHFKMSANANNASGIFNLALLYEQGLGVIKNMNTALKLYQLAATLGHDKALFNLGVYSSQGLGGVKKSFRTAKRYFEEAASYGNADAIEALSLLLPKKNFSQDPIDFISEDEKSPRTSVTDSTLYHKHKSLQSIAVG